MVRIRKSRLHRQLEAKLDRLRRREARTSEAVAEVEARLRKLTAAKLAEAGVVGGAPCRIKVASGRVLQGVVSQVSGPESIDVHVPHLHGYFFVHPRNLTLLKRNP